MIRFLFIIIVYVGCNTPIKENTLTTVRWDESDLQLITNRIVSKILSSSTIDFSKKYSFGKITNRTYDHIDTKLLANKISTALIKSKKIILLEEDSNALFIGEISSIFKKNGRTKDMYFNFNLTLMDTQRVIWSEDIEIRKVYKKALFGW
jgi:PBP1b-binding outer membrane lipoprotein LpoB